MCATTGPCDLCGRDSGREPGFRQSTLRGGSYSAVIVRQELRAMKVGGMLVSRPKLPKAMLQCLSGNPQPWPVWTPVAGRKPWRLQYANGDYLHDANGQALQFDSPQSANRALKSPGRMARCA